MIPSILEDALGFNLNRVSLLFRRELMRALAEYNMTPEQWIVMITLWTTGKPISQTDIVAMTLKDKHTVSRIIQRLTRDGWIEKKVDQHDARVTMIKPTPKGGCLKNEVPQKLNEHFIKILENFSEEETDVLLKTLKKLREILGDYSS